MSIRRRIPPLFFMVKRSATPTAPSARRRVARVPLRCAGLCALLGILGSAPAAQAEYYSETRAHQGRELTEAEGKKHSRSLEESVSGFRDVADQLQRLPEIRVRRSGGSNAPAYMSIRGSEANAVAIYLDGIPLNGGHQSSVSLNMVLPELLRSADVYRSNAPLHLGSNLPGGAVNLHLRDARRPGYVLTAGGGSFGSAKAGLIATYRAENSRTLIATAWRGAQGNYTFFNNNGTDFNLDDDNHRETRINNRRDEISLLIHHEAQVRDWRLTVLSMSDFQLYGLPGLDIMQAEHAHGRDFSQILAMKADRHGLQDGTLDLHLQGSLMARRMAFNDEQGEIGYGTNDRSDGHVQARLASDFIWWLPNHHRIRVHAESVAEVYTPRDHIMPLNLEQVSRIAPQIGLGWAWRTANRLLELDASIRNVHWIESARGTETPSLQLGQSHSHLIGAQVGAVLAPIREAHHALQIFTYGSHTGRAPDFTERFGNNGSSTGNSSLKNETQWQVELGVSHRYKHQATEFVSHITGYTQWRHDAIEYVANPVGIRTPVNLANARVSGLEAALGVHSRYVGTDVSVARLWTKNAGDIAAHYGMKLPWRSDWSVHGSLYAQYRGVRMDWNTNWDSAFFGDGRNRRTYPERWLHDLKISYRPEFLERLEISFEVQNITDERVRNTTIRDGGRDIQVPRAIADYRGYPLPGRAFYANLTWRGSFSSREHSP